MSRIERPAAYETPRAKGHPQRHTDVNFFVSDFVHFLLYLRKPIEVTICYCTLFIHLQAEEYLKIYFNKNKTEKPFSLQDDEKCDKTDKSY